MLLWQMHCQLEDPRSASRNKGQCSRWPSFDATHLTRAVNILDEAAVAMRDLTRLKIRSHPGLERLLRRWLVRPRTETTQH